MRKMLFLLLPLMAATITACGGGDDDEGGSHALMAPGENCMRSGCHGNFTLAGTVFPSATSSASAGIAGVSVVVTDANNTQTTLTSNAAGNFYTGKAMAWPLQVSVVRNGQTTEMSSPLSSAAEGACASCHSLGSDLGAVYAN